MKPRFTLLIWLLLLSFFGCKDDPEKKETCTSKQPRCEWQTQFGNLSNKTIADIGAGYGFDAIPMAKTAKKIIAIDIDPGIIQLLDSLATANKLPNLEPRLTQPDNPGLVANEADGVLIVNTYMYISNRINYLERLSKGMKSGGKLVIVDYKKKETRIGPRLEDKVPFHEVVEELKKANYTEIETDEITLEDQYIIVARNP